MENTYFENNKVTVIGRVCSNPAFSHMIYGERFYMFQLEIPRLSENYDTINITVSERFFPVLEPKLGDILRIEGQFRSYNSFSQTGSRLILTVFAREITYAEHPEEHPDPNQIFLNGYICKPPIYRTTPFQREIADILLAVNRFYHKSDYIPCIAWGRNAKFARRLEVGTHLKVWGRIQSREYQKRLDDDQLVTRTAYEISISKMELELDIPQETECSENG
ncbi:single-stranded DNA-binding protein [Ructibacterium gallinarum]|uniref:Single-stranded DNA-binding protein n=1 Tax=Ructibacterium gallinarum TaxID=2779355 RepID=A0A9D5M6B6_9FIRM|nr:single-stranded DNA-binding protein [Ructibacterium gallinarum]